jgi:serine/threonine-protein phosphatase 5
MASPKERAIALKNEGNKAVAAHDWNTAIDLYTQAIEFDDKQAAFYSNRAQARNTPRAASTVWASPYSLLA